jgi:NAD(P)-dependent dehydrogenase (short-subunit alcohol dehydrogenase family)
MTDGFEALPRIINVLLELVMKTGSNICVVNLLKDILMKISFENKVVLVTGAGGGLGLAAAKAFAEAGASVAMADWDEKLVTAAAEELAKQGFKTLAIRCDVADDAQVEAMVAKTVATFGRLDVAYNNAGVQNELIGAAEQRREDFDRVIGINLRGIWSCMKFELQQMRKQKSGAIVNCSSIGGIRGGSMRGTYHAAKHGVIGLTTSAAIEYASQGVRVNAISPGLFYTPMAEKMIEGGQKEALDGMIKAVPIGRMGKAEEIADAVLWLCSDKASMVVGHNLVVDGGLTI